MNGRIIGVPVYFYDDFLLSAMPAGDFMVGRLLGTVMGRITGVGDRWLYMRIQAMLKAGELTAVSPPRDDHPYSGIVRRREVPG